MVTSAAKMPDCAGKTPTEPRRCARKPASKPEGVTFAREARTDSAGLSSLERFREKYSRAVREAQRMHAGRRFVISMLLLAALFLAQSACAGAAEDANKPIPETASSEKTVYLTFDDGPSEITLLILDVLKEHHVP